MKNQRSCAGERPPWELLPPRRPAAQRLTRLEASCASCARRFFYTCTVSSLMLLEVWRVYQPDCPVVAASESLPGVRLSALSSRLCNGRVYGFLYVGRGASSRLVELLRRDARVAEAGVIARKGRGAVISMVMRSTLLMDTLSSSTRVFYFAPVFALDGYEYFVVAHVRKGLPEVKSLLKETGHELKVLQSSELPELPLGRAVLEITRLYRLLSERELCHSSSLEVLIASRSLSEASSATGKSKSQLSRERRRALSSYAKILKSLSSLYKDFCEASEA